MKYRIEFQKAALKFIRKQDKKTQERLLAAISKLPDGTDVKKLQGYEALYRMRVGTMRILYRVDDFVKIVSIEDIDSRGDIYKGL